MSSVSADRSITRPQFLAWLTAFVGWLFDYYEIALMTFLVVPISAEFDLTSRQSALLLSLQLLGIAVGGVLFGYLGDRIGRRRVLMITILIFGLFTLARAFAPDYGTLVAFGIIAAIGLGGEFGVGQALVTEVMPADKRGFWGGALYSGVGLGLAAAALVSGYVLPAVGWRWVFAISCFPILLAVVVRFWAPESDQWEQQARGERVPTDWRLVRSSLFLKPLVLCLVACAIEFFAFYAVASFLPTFLIEVQGFSFSRAAWWTVVVGIAIFIGSIMCGVLADRIGRRPTWFVMSSIAALGAVVLGITFEMNAAGYWTLVPIFVLYVGTGVAAAFGMVFAEQFPTRLRSLGVGTSLQVGRGLSFFPPLIAAAVYPVYGYSPLVFGSAVLFAILAGLGWLFREGKGRSVDELDEHFAPATTGRTANASPGTDSWAGGAPAPVTSTTTSTRGLS
jgi:putative MFS transporter